MRRVAVLILFLLPGLIVQAQDISNFTCATEETYRSQFAITPPAISDTLTDITITTIGLGNFEPVIGVTTADNFTDCYSNSPEAQYIQLTLPDGELQPSFTDAAGVVYFPGTNTVHIANANGNTGAAITIFETIIIDGNHSYQIEMTDAMIASGELNVYLLSLDPNYEPSLTVTDSEGAQTQVESADVTGIAFFGEVRSAVSAPLPQIAGTTTMTVNAGMPGVYALLIEMQSGAIVEGDGIATVAQSEDGTFSLICEAEEIFTNGMRVQFPDDNDYTATVLASPNDSVLALLDDAESGFCYDDSPGSYDYIIDLPSITTELDTINAQAVVTPETDSIVFGGRESAPGDYVLVIEGGEIADSDEGDVFEIPLTPQMKSASAVITAYVFTTEIELDPILTWESENGEPVVCNDAGIPDLCDQEHETFNDSYITLSNGISISGVDFNPMLEIPLDPTVESDSIRLRVTANEETSGQYILVLHLITD